MPHVRPVHAVDADAIASIYDHYVAHTVVTFELDPVTADTMRSRIDEIAALALPWHVVEDDGAVLGYAYATRWRARPAYRHSVETTVYLHPDATGRGLGRLLYGDLLDALRRDGYHTAIGGIALPNAASVALHEALGFVPVGEFREVGRKFGRWIDVGFWQRMLQDAL
jgi:L-amino acid N-acyltransferase YncA